MSSNVIWGPLWPWWYGSWIYNYLCNQYPSSLMLYVRISMRARYTTLCDKVCHWLPTSWWFFPGPLLSSTNNTDRHDITEILLKVALNTIKQTNKQNNVIFFNGGCTIFRNNDIIDVIFPGIHSYNVNNTKGTPKKSLHPETMRRHNAWSEVWFST